MEISLEIEDDSKEDEDELTNLARQVAAGGAPGPEGTFSNKLSPTAPSAAAIKEAIARVEAWARGEPADHGLWIQRGRLKFCGRCGLLDEDIAVCEFPADRNVVAERIETRIRRETRTEDAIFGFQARYRRDIDRRTEARKGLAKLHVSEAIKNVVGGWNRR